MTAGASSSNSDTSPNKKKGWPRGKKRRIITKDINAPKGPLSGYMMFMNQQRDELKQSESKLGFQEINKVVAQKWAQLEASEKKKFLEAAEADKGRYQLEVEKYKKTDTYKKFMKDQKKGTPSAKRPKKETMITNEKISNNNQQEVSTNNSILEIPIFTEEFLNHNKVREGELRQLRKSNMDYEEQNTILQKHIESLTAAVRKLEEEMLQQKAKNDSLKMHLATLRRNLTQAFLSVPVPGTDVKASEKTVDNYMNQLHTVLSSNPQQHQKVIQNVKQIVNNLPSN